MLDKSTRREIFARHRDYSRSAHCSAELADSLRSPTANHVHVCLLLFIVIVISVAAETWSKNRWASVKNHRGENVTEKCLSSALLASTRYIAVYTVFKKSRYFF